MKPPAPALAREERDRIVGAARPAIEHPHNGTTATPPPIPRNRIERIEAGERERVLEAVRSVYCEAEGWTTHGDLEARARRFIEAVRDELEED